VTTSSIKDQLVELLEQSREYAKYSGELGVETVTMTEVFESHVAATEAASTPVEATTSTAKSGLFKRAPAPTVHAPTRSRSTGAKSAPTDLLFEELATVEPSLPHSTEALNDIWQDIGDCTRCGLCAGRTQVVNTHGNPQARLMFVGEAPGADEDAQGKPFVGRAGQLLTKMIEAMGMKREDVIIGNVNRCRPPANRQPTLEEAAICRPFLFREISVIQPEVIVVMGNTALRNLLEVREGITRVRGKFQDFRGIKVMPTFHPAYLLRDPSKKRETWEDLKMVMEYLDSHPPTTSNN
jgi:uracil-DNA glycosylase family 4